MSPMYLAASSNKTNNVPSPRANESFVVLSKEKHANKVPSTGLQAWKAKKNSTTIDTEVPVDI